jgi:ABC-type glycerol-3-phosphate transport system substrate-binding protein
MRNRQTIPLSAGIMVILFIFLGACQRAETSPTATITNTASSGASENAVPTETPYPAPVTPSNIQPTSQAYPQPSSRATATQTINPSTPPGRASSTPIIKTTQTLTSSPPDSASQGPQEIAKTQETQAIETPTSSPTIANTAAYPGPGAYPTLTQPYPGPYFTPTQIPYPGSSTPTSRLTPIPSGSQAPSMTARITPTTNSTGVFSSPTPRSTAPAGTVLPQGTPFELPPPQPVSPPPPGSAVTIWYSWNFTEVGALQDAIQAYQRIYPDVTFTLQFIPLNDLYDTYYQAAYLGTGPSLLLGPAEWGIQLFDSELITNLSPYVPSNFLSDINPAALASGQYHGKLISLPLSQHGVVMFRNRSIIDTEPETFDQLISLAQQATHAGVVGSYLERGSFFSAADIIGLGGLLMDEKGYPMFNDSSGLQWFHLLADYDVAGAVTFNTNLDLNMFKRGRVGIIIDGTWNTENLQEAIGTENLAIDSWPTYGNGHLAGWVQADSVFLNSNTTGDDRFAALAFMGYLLDPNVQKVLAEVGHIPSVMTTQPRDPIIEQAMAAFTNGAAYPISIDDNLLQLYWNELDKAIQDVFSKGADPASALKTASQNLDNEIINLTTTP